MKATKDYPEAIKETGTKERILFLSEVIHGKDKELVPMVSNKDGVKEIERSEVVGLKLPVYMRLLTTLIFTGTLATV